MRVFYLIVIISFFWGCDNEEKSIKKLTVDAFEKRHQQNIETLTVLCPMKENAIQCLKMYDIEYRTFEGKKYLYQITYK